MEIPIPDHTTLCRRLRMLGELSFPAVANDRPIHLLIDSTGLRIHVGSLRKPPKRRAWRKLHLAVNANTGEIVASDLTGRRTHDCTQVPVLLEQLNGRVASVSADGAYDTTRTLRSTISTFVATEDIENRWKILGIDDFDFGIDEEFRASMISSFESSKDFQD